jgi:hypothetical protein
MAHINTDSSFQSWVLTPEEFKQGAMLSITQKQVIQNRVCMLAQQRLNLDFDPINALSFAQQEAGIKGAIDALNYLLIQSAQAENPSIPSGE